MFYITGLVESEPSHIFGTPTCYCTLTWFGANILWHNTRILIIWEGGSNCYFRKETVMTIGLTQGVTFLVSTTEIQLLLSSQCTFGATVCIDKASVYLWIALVSLTALYKYLISSSVESEATSG